MKYLKWYHWLVLSIGLYLVIGNIYYLSKVENCYIESGVVITKYYSSRGGYSVTIEGINKYSGKKSICLENIPWKIGEKSKVGDTININN